MVNRTNGVAAPPPPPMPKVAAAQVYLDDMIEALQRAKSAWNAAQFRDAMRSVAYFMGHAERALDRAPSDAALEGK